MQIGEVFRYARPYSPKPESRDGLPNFFHATNSPGLPLVLLDRGIAPPAKTDAVDGPRTSAILISSSPHKRGSEETPWHDLFDVDNGRVLYYGDNKTYKTRAHDAPGNALLLDQFRLHTSPEPELRAQAAPLLLFERVTRDNRVKGQIAFRGVALITRVDLVTQLSPSTHEYFSNFRFEFCVLSLKSEGEQFDWTWIHQRRDKDLPTVQTARLAPAAWRQWLKEGPAAIERIRRRVLRTQISVSREQIPLASSPEEVVRDLVYRRYSTKRTAFENIASYVVGSYLRRHFTNYREGWVTPEGSDEGVDFVGRIDIGINFARTQLVVLGQAKCEKPNSPTNGNHIARTVARLRRGWIGAYVTTSHFSEAVQREIANDDYPLLMINGLDLARELLSAAPEEGFGSVGALLDFIDARREKMIAKRRPEEIVRDSVIGSF